MIGLAETSCRVQLHVRAHLVASIVATGTSSDGDAIAAERVRRERNTPIAILGERDPRHSENECQSVCHIEAVSLAIGRFYFDGATGDRSARCSAPRRVPERSRVASIRARPPRKIRNIVAPGLCQTGGDESGRAVCVSACVTASAVRIRTDAYLRVVLRKIRRGAWHPCRSRCCCCSLTPSS